MGKINKLYKKNVYGIMGTLIFHIVLMGSFLVAGLDFNDAILEEVVMIDFSQVFEEIIESGEDISGVPPDVINNPSNENENASDNRTVSSNRPVNLGGRGGRTSNDPFFDEDYRREIAAAERLVADVDKQLLKKAQDISQIEMPVITTEEGMSPDSVKNTVYAGESNISYNLSNRYHLRLPVPVYLAYGGGTVTVDISVASSGKVTKAEVRLNAQYDDPLLPEYAKQAALRTVFNSDPSAPTTQQGTITYTFIPQ